MKLKQWYQFARDYAAYQHRKDIDLQAQWTALHQLAVDGEVEGLSSDPATRSDEIARWFAAARESTRKR